MNGIISVSLNCNPMTLAVTYSAETTCDLLSSALPGKITRPNDRQYLAEQQAPW